MNKISLYSSLPYWLQNIAVSLHGYKLKRQRFNDDFYKILDFLDSTHGWSKEQIRSYKEEHTFKILEQAYNHCPYYRKKYADAGLSPSDFKKLEDLRKFPILTKEEVRYNLDGMIADNVSKKDLIHYHTSGSTGKALDFFYTKYSLPFYWAVDQRYKNRFGFELDNPCFNFSPRPVVPVSSNKLPYWRYDSVLNRYFISMQQINKSKIEAIVDFINKKNMIHVFIGYPSVMTALANEIEASHKAITNIPEHIFIGAEKLYENQKIILKRVFPGVKIHELYSFSEHAAIATHCVRGNYHEDFEIGHMEPYNSEKVEGGILGEILATDYINMGVPFIRYQNGDTAIFSNSNCDCGLNSQVLLNIMGRNGDCVYTPEGVSIRNFWFVFENISEAKECQIVQKELEEIVIRVVKRENYNTSVENKILLNIRQWVSPSIKVKFEYVDEIPRTKAGKFKAVVSELKK